jgi:hypothetical protein
MEVILLYQPFYIGYKLGTSEGKIRQRQVLIMTEELIIRPYNISDKEALLRILKLNTPKYFSPEEEVDLVYYLQNEIE